MTIAVDTNVLVRLVTRDDEAQAQATDAVLEQASRIAVSLTSLSEFAWVLRGVYGFPREDIVSAIQMLLDVHNVAVDRPAAEAGLAVLRAGGDFADGVIAYEGRQLGGDTFASFDRKAIAILANQGYVTKLMC